MKNCIMCQIRQTLNEAMEMVDALPEIESPLYDDAIARAYNEIESAYYLFAHGHDDDVKKYAYVCKNCGRKWKQTGVRRNCPRCGSDILQSTEIGK